MKIKKIDRRIMNVLQTFGTRLLLFGVKSNKFVKLFKRKRHLPLEERLYCNVLTPMPIKQRSQIPIKYKSRYLS